MRMGPLLKIVTLVPATNSSVKRSDFGRCSTYKIASGAGEYKKAGRRILDKGLHPGSVDQDRIVFVRLLPPALALYRDNEIVLACVGHVEC